MITKHILSVCFVIVFFIFTAAGVVAKTVKVEGKNAYLDVPTNAKASLVLLPGDAGLYGTGKKDVQDTLLRSRKKYVEKGYAVLSIDQETDIQAAIEYASSIATPVFIAAVGSGVSKLAGAITAPGFRANKVVFVSGNLDSVREIVGNPDKLPPTLVIHHRKDGCSKTPPKQVDMFQEWGGNKVTVNWMEGGSNKGFLCGSLSYHGMGGLDDEVVNTISSFLEK
jgi:hypothetical protein